MKVFLNTEIKWANIFNMSSAEFMRNKWNPKEWKKEKKHIIPFYSLNTWQGNVCETERKNTERMRNRSREGSVREKSVHTHTRKKMLMLTKRSKWGKNGIKVMQISMHSTVALNASYRWTSWYGDRWKEHTHTHTLQLRRWFWCEHQNQTKEKSVCMYEVTVSLWINMISNILRTIEW